MRSRPPELDLRDKVVLLTGATGGLGGVLARRLAERGASLALSGRDEGKLTKLSDELNNTGGRAVAVPADLSSPGALAPLVAKVVDELGAVDVAVSNAGVEFYGAYTRHELPELAETINVNLLSPMALVRAVLPGMLARKTGHVVLMSSISGKAPNPYGAAYAASKAGLVGLSSSLRTELAGSGVSCSVVCPSFVTDVDDGMFIRIQREGLSTPKLVGVAPAARCADAVLRVLRTDEPEVIVSDKPLRLMLAAGALWPAVPERLLAKTGVTEFFRGVSERRGRL